MLVQIESHSSPNQSKLIHMQPAFVRLLQAVGKKANAFAAYLIARHGGGQNEINPLAERRVNGNLNGICQWRWCIGQNWCAETVRRTLEKTIAKKFAYYIIIPAVGRCTTFVRTKWRRCSRRRRRWWWWKLMMMMGWCGGRQRFTGGLPTSTTLGKFFTYPGYHSDGPSPSSSVIFGCASIRENNLFFNWFCCCYAGSKCTSSRIIRRLWTMVVGSSGIFADFRHDLCVCG